MFKQLVSFAKKHWIIILAILVIVVIGFFTLGKKKEGMYDYELAGCSTCDAGDAGVLLDTETEMYNMPDDYYSVDENIEEADDDQLVLMNPDEIAAVVTDREATNVPVRYYSESEFADTTFADNISDGLEEKIVSEDSEEDVVYDDSEFDKVNYDDQVEEEENENMEETVTDDMDELQLIPLDESYETDFTDL